MPKPIKVYITSDFLCPWCYLGVARLLKAVQSLHMKNEVELEWQPYELNPDMPSQGMDRKSYRTRKFGWERSLRMDAQLAALGVEAGLDFNFSAITRASNTRLAHRLTQFAQLHGLASEYALGVFKAYFEEGIDIGARPKLLQIVMDVGLDPKEAEDFLDRGEGEEAVVAAQLKALYRGIQRVPSFEIGERIISGAQDTAEFCDALQASGLPPAQEDSLR